MKIIALTENTSQQAWPVEHGLSLYIELNGLHILFDMGQSNLFAENAARKGIDLEKVDLAILSHGHYDHGGGLKTFLQMNSHAPVYVHRRAFEPHYSLRSNGLHYIGLNTELQYHPNLKFCDSYTYINNQLQLFTQTEGKYLCPPGNRLLFGPALDTPDTFCHEQSLLISEGHLRVLIAGCAHTGIINILQKAQQLSTHPITHVFAGMHLTKSGLTATEEAAFIKQLAEKLLAYPGCHYYTMHCTGIEAYTQLKQYMQDRINYLSTGDDIIVQI
ncbi:metallo-beta-lactamase family protein [gut metagenome]|uniref:Metallo-beta-lactamase family protein n=1 Tax=gut metagenome TaxID=749906 RepID=J9GI64_9ZZZZ